MNKRTVENEKVENPATEKRNLVRSASNQTEEVCIAEIKPEEAVEFLEWLRKK